MDVDLFATSSLELRASCRSVWFDRVHAISPQETDHTEGDLYVQSLNNAFSQSQVVSIMSTFVLSASV